MSRISCPACKGRGRSFGEAFGDPGVTCGECAGTGEVTSEKAESILDRQTITRGEAKRLIADAVRKATRPPRAHRPKTRGTDV